MLPFGTILKRAVGAQSSQYADPLALLVANMNRVLFQGSGDGF